MPDLNQERFDSRALAWAAYNQSPLGRIRRDVTWRCLVRHLPPVIDPNDPPRVLDLGGGTGELALRLVRDGYHTWLVDYAPAMVDQARVKAESLSSDARARLQVSAMDAADLPRVFSPGVFDVVVCHTLIEYLPDPEAILTILAPLLKPGGVFSLSFVNRTAEVLRQVVRKQDLVAARRALTTGGFRASLFGISGTAYAVEDVVDWMANLGFAIIASYGIRILADHLPPASLADPDFFGELLDLEADLSRCQSFLPTARYVNLVCSRAVET